MCLIRKLKGLLNDGKFFGVTAPLAGRFLQVGIVSCNDFVVVWRKFRYLTHKYYSSTL